MLLDITGSTEAGYPLAANDRGMDLPHRLMAAVAQAPTAIAICDRRFRPSFANDAARRLIGLGATEPLPEHSLGRLVAGCSTAPDLIRAALAASGHWEGRLHLASPAVPGGLDVQATISRFGAADAEAGVLISAAAPSDAAPEAMSDEQLVNRCQRLSEREREVVLGLLRGGSNKSVGQLLELSPRTVEYHRAKLMLRFGAQSLLGLRAAILHDAMAASGG